MEKLSKEKSNLYQHYEELPTVQFSRSKMIADMQVEHLEILVKDHDIGMCLRAANELLYIFGEKKEGVVPNEK